jgi:mannosyltransferase OCH1-like enzyme
MLRCDFPAAQRHLGAAARVNAAHRVSHGGGAKPSQSLLGQILDEFRIDAELGERLRDAMEAEDEVERIAEAVREAPESTAAAMALMIALRRRGRLAPAAAEGAPNPIPRAIAQFWDENIPADVEKLCEDWRTAHPDFAYRRFSSLDAARFLAARGPSGAVAAFQRAREPAMKADLFRLAWLARNGGWYIDADDRRLGSLGGLDPGGRELILFQEENFGSTGNNFIGVAPEHPVIVSALDQAVAAINRGDSDILWLSTGPALLTRRVAAWLAEDLDARLARTLVLSPAELGRFVAVFTAASYKHTSKHWSRTVFGKARDLLRARTRDASMTTA